MTYLMLYLHWRHGFILSGLFARNGENYKGPAPDHRPLGERVTMSPFCLNFFHPPILLYNSHGASNIFVTVFAPFL